MIQKTGAPTPQRLLISVPITEREKRLETAGRIAGEIPIWATASKFIEAPLALRIPGKTFLSKATRFIAGSSASTPFVRPLITEGRMTPKQVGKETLADIATAGFFAGALRPISKLIPKGTISKAAKETFQEAGKSKTLSEGLFNESFAQTKFRRKAGFAPGDVYKGEKTSNIKAPEWFNKNPMAMGDFQKSIADFEVKTKANLLDLFRTPNRVLQKIGLGDEATLLRQKYDNYRQELPKEINRITEWSKRVDDPEGNKRIFNYLDGKLPRLDNPFELKVAKEIKAYLKAWAVRLNLPEDKQISNYITHIFPKGALEKEFDPELAKLIRGKVVKSVYDPFLEKRVGKPDFIEDTWQALDAYVKRATRKYHVDQALEQIALKAENLPQESYNYIKKHVARINMQPTDIDNLIDNTIKQSPIGYKFGQRPVTALTQKARQMVFRGLLGLNPASALRNIQQSTNTYAVLGERDFATGLMKTLLKEPQYLTGKTTELDKVGVLGKDIIQDRTLNATKKFWERADKVLFYLFDQAEKFNRSVAFYGAKAKALRSGRTEIEAVEFAKGIVAKTQFNYDVIDTPAVLQSDLSKTIFQFAKYPLAQSEFLIEMVKDKNVAGSLRWLASNLLFVAIAGKALGLEVKDMFPQFRFGVPPTTQLPYGVFQGVTGAPDKYGNEPEGGIIERIVGNKNVQRGFLNYVPAGGQIRKTFSGIGAFRKGGSFTPSGQMRFPVDQRASSLVRNALFGEYSGESAREYVQSGFKPYKARTKDRLKDYLLEGKSPKELERQIKIANLSKDDFKDVIKEAIVDFVVSKNDQPLNRFLSQKTSATIVENDQSFKRLMKYANAAGIKKFSIETAIRASKSSPKVKRQTMERLVKAVRNKDQEKAMTLRMQALSLGFNDKEIMAEIRHGSALRWAY